VRAKRHSTSGSGGLEGPARRRPADIAEALAATRAINQDARVLLSHAWGAPAQAAEQLRLARQWAPL